MSIRPIVIDSKSMKIVENLHLQFCFSEKVKNDRGIGSDVYVMDDRQNKSKKIIDTRDPIDCKNFIRMYEGYQRSFKISTFRE